MVDILSPLDDDTRSIGGKMLTKAEYRIMRLLTEHFGKAVSKISIYNALWFDDPQEGPECEEKILQVYICRIRKKLRGTGHVIITHWAFGYRLCRQDDPNIPDKYRQLADAEAVMITEDGMWAKNPGRNAKMRGKRSRDAA